MQCESLLQGSDHQLGHSASMVCMLYSCVRNISGELLHRRRFVPRQCVFTVPHSLCVLCVQPM